MLRKTFLAILLMAMAAAFLPVWGGRSGKPATAHGSRAGNPNRNCLSGYRHLRGRPTERQFQSVCSLQPGDSGSAYQGRD
jgi:hypothetical protein